MRQEKLFDSILTLWARLFSVLCGEMGSTRSAPGCLVFVLRNSPCGTELQPELSCAVSRNTIVTTWKDRWQYDYSDLVIWQVFSWQWTRQSYHEEQIPVIIFVANDNIWAFTWKFKFWKSCFQHHELNSFIVL